ncbi:MAG: hypothetical protein IE933_07170 [Sphingomonadales bacterium]|nr:hypothetical protein [Sphingomonadales bacterium]MBD3772480.1 hypothetical protein [Paracoccaceae bacterium]
MTEPTTLRRLAMGAFAGAMALLLSGCMLMPGKFVSEMVLLKGGTFSYSYEGEIHLLSMSKLAQMGAAADAEFTPESCYDEDYNDRECTDEEIAEQKAAWEEAAAAKQERQAKDAEQMRALFGGIDPSDPASGDELAARMQRQAGFDKVVNKGDGLFEVSFHVKGRLDHDFVFPTFERFPMFGFFVMANARDDGSVRIDAPGFAAQTQANPMAAMMGGMNMAGTPGDGDGGSDMPPMPEMDGVFTIVTDGEILANNTDEGPVADPRGRKLVWKVDRSTTAAPTALIKLN